MSVEFESPAARVIEQFSGKKESEFRIPADLPDLTFLRRLSIQGRLRYFQGDNGTAPFITITPNVGETIFIYKVICSNNAAAGNLFTMTNDGNLRFNVRLASTTTGGSTQEITLMDSLVGNGTKTMLFDGSGNGDISVFGWSENTSRIRDVTI